MTLSTRLIGPNWEVVKATNSHVRARWYTPYLQWLDVVDLYFASSGPDTVRVDARSVSTGLCPSSCLGAPLLSCILCWVPFLDHGKNKEHLQGVKDAAVSDPTTQMRIEEGTRDLRSGPSHYRPPSETTAGY